MYKYVLRVQESMPPDPRGVFLQHPIDCLKPTRLRNWGHCTSVRLHRSPEHELRIGSHRGPALWTHFRDRNTLQASVR